MLKRIAKKKLLGLQLKPYQKRASRFIIKNEYSAIFADPGMGKTVIVLEAIKKILCRKPKAKILIVAPLDVIKNVWPAEIKKWKEYKDLTYRDLHSKKDNNKRSNIYLINPESLHNISDFKRYSMLVIDESTQFKSPSGKRFKYYRDDFLSIPKRVILTGTPTPKSIQDLWSQIYLLDKGKALGKNITQYRNKYFNFQSRGFGAKRWPVYTPKRRAFSKVSYLISDFTLRIEDKKSKDPLFNNIVVKMDKSEYKTYKSMEKNLFAEIKKKKVFAVSAAVAYNHCQQLANGALYDPEKSRYLGLHNKKLDALERLIEELHGKSVLVGYRFKHDLDRIRKRLGKIPTIKDKGAIAKWNNQKIPIMLMQLQNTKGLNLYMGGMDIVFFSLTDNYENYIQFIRRLWGSNRNRFVRVHHIICDKTVDVAIIRRLEARELGEKSFLDCLKSYRIAKTYIQ